MTSDSILDKDLAELIGAFIGDGFIGKYGSHYHVEFIGNKDLDREYFQFLSRIMTTRFKVKPKLLIREGALRMIITYKELYNFFRGLFDTDGYIFTDKRAIYKTPYTRIGFSTKNRKLYNQLKVLFSRKGYSLYTRTDKRSDVHNIEIYGNSQVSRWVKEFGFSNINKKNYASIAQLVERQRS